LEFRLCGSEGQTQTIPVPVSGSGSVIVAIDPVRAFLSGGGPAAAARTAIGGVEARAQYDAGQVVCTAQLSEFDPGDLVVVQVELAVYAVGMPA
jgi:hypothetical protein